MRGSSREKNKHKPSLETARSVCKQCPSVVKSSQNLTEKEVPHEQPFSAWGLLTTWKELRISSWLKSTMDPFTKARLSTSTTTRAPPCSNTLQKKAAYLTINCAKDLTEKHNLSALLISQASSLQCKILSSHADSSCHFC